MEHETHMRDMREIKAMKKFIVSMYSAIVII